MTLETQTLNQIFSTEKYLVTIRPCTDTSGYWAECQMDNGGCVVQGETLHETQKKMIEALELYLEEYPDVTNYYLDFELRSA